MELNVGTLPYVPELEAHWQNAPSHVKRYEILKPKRNSGHAERPRRRV